MSKDKKSQLGFCGICHSKSKEIPAVAIIGKVHLCGLHITKDAKDYTVYSYGYF